ncbi:MAG: hypothetical protein AAGB04_00695 [Pseudomonadota bacterium]
MPLEDENQLIDANAESLLPFLAQGLGGNPVGEFLIGGASRLGPSFLMA